MATYYWYVANNGNATWGTGTTGWYNGPGGTSGSAAAAPTSADTLIWNAASGSGICTVSGTRSCYNIDMTGFNGTITGSGTAIISVYGTSVILSSAGIFDISNNPKLNFTGGTSITTNLTTNGQTVGHIDINNGTTVVLQDNLIAHTNTIFNLIYGTFNANGKNVTIGYFSDNNSTSAKTLTMGSGTWNIIQGGPLTNMVVHTGATRGPELVWYISQPSSMTLDAGTSTLRFILASEAAGLSSAISSSPSLASIVLVDSTGFPTTGGTVLIDDEQISYSSLNANTLVLSQRGVNGTAITTHSAGAAVILLKNKTTTLTSSVTSSSTTIPLADTTNMEAAGHALVDGEIIEYTSSTGSTLAGNTISTITYPLGRGITYTGFVLAGSAASHSAGATIRQCEGRSFYAGAKTYNVIDFYQNAVYGYIWTYIYGGFTANLVKNSGGNSANTGYQNIMFVTGTYTVNSVTAMGASNKPIYIKYDGAGSPPWTITGNNYNNIYYTTGYPSPTSTAVLPYVDTKSGHFFEFL